LGVSLGLIVGAVFDCYPINVTMTAQTQEELLAAHLEQQKIDLDEPVVEDDE
ncbi:unnamed protein product, partial [Musa acuminata var. zebrina]